MSDYVINMGNLSEMSVACIDYSNRLADAVEGMADTVHVLNSSERISGETAEAVKSYFNEVHAEFLGPAVLTACRELRDEFGQYLKKYHDSPIGERKLGNLASRDIVYARNQAREWAYTDFVLINEAVCDAVGKVEEASCSVGTIYVGDLLQGLYDLDDRLAKLNNDIANAEVAGLALFSSRKEYETVMRCLRQAIAACAKLSKTSYVSGAFREISCVQEVLPFLQKYQDNWNEHSEVRIETENNAIETVELQKKLEYEKKKQDKLMWDRIGTIFSVGATLLACTALIAVTGPIGLAVGSLGVYKSMSGSAERVEGLIAEGSGKGDISETKENEIAIDHIKGIGKEAVKGVGKGLGEWEKVCNEGNMMTDGYLVFAKGANSFVAGAAGEIASGYTELVLYSLTGDANVANAEGDLAGSLAENGVKLKLEGLDSFDATDFISIGFKIGSVVSDYYSGECAQEMSVAAQAIEHCEDLKESNAQFTPSSFCFA